MKNEALEAWVLLVASHVKPARIHWCDGSEREFEELCEQLVTDGVLKRLDAPDFADCFVQRSESGREVEPKRPRYVCTPHRSDAGPTNAWMHEDEAYRLVWSRFADSMKGRTLFVAPYLLGAPGSRYAQVGVQLTDSPLAVVKLKLLTRMGRAAMDHLGRSGDFMRGLHSRGLPGRDGEYVVHFPATQTCWSIGSERTEQAVFGHKLHALSMTSARAPEEGYLAEHMSVARITTPLGKRYHIAAAFPAGCGKSELASLCPTLPRWHVELVADGMVFTRVGDDGKLWAINPAAGIDGKVTGGILGSRSNPAPNRNAIFDGAESCARDGARCIAPAERWQGVGRGFFEPEGVPLSAIVFGARRSALTPLVFEATSWEHGVYVGASSRSEVGQRGGESGSIALQSDPMAMLPYCPYNLGDYFSHWLDLGRQLRSRPRIFHVNWFRTSPSGKLMWPGFGENIRVIEWMVDRLEHAVDARSTPIGLVPRTLNVSGLDLGPDVLDRLLQVDLAGWRAEASATLEFLSQFGERLPKALMREHQGLVRRLQHAMN